MASFPRELIVFRTNSLDFAWAALDRLLLLDLCTWMCVCVLTSIHYLHAYMKPHTQEWGRELCTNTWMMANYSKCTEGLHPNCIGCKSCTLRWVLFRLPGTTPSNHLTGSREPHLYMKSKESEACWDFGSALDDLVLPPWLQMYLKLLAELAASP